MGKCATSTAAEPHDHGAIDSGLWFIANPDLPARLRSGALLNGPRAGVIDGSGAEGYTDYTSLQQAS